jgi:hypothetical protein
MQNEVTWSKSVSSKSTRSKILDNTCETYSTETQTTHITHVHMHVDITFTSIHQWAVCTITPTNWLLEEYNFGFQSTLMYGLHFTK